MYQANTRPVKVGQGQLGVKTRCTQNNILRGNTTHSVIWCPSLEREPAAEQQCHKNQENTETGEHKNSKSIQNHLTRSPLPTNWHPISLNRTGKLNTFVPYHNELDGLYDALKDFREWPHPAETIEPKYKRDDMNYKIEIYADGSKNDKGVGSRIAIFVDGNLTYQLRSELADKCSNNQAEQLAIAKALEKVKDLQVKRNQRTLALHTDSRMTLEAIANQRNRQNLVELIREEITCLENNSWIVHFTWVKAHNNSGNELADQLAKEAACGGELDIAYNKYAKSAVISELKELGLRKWRIEWDSSSKGALIKTLFPKVKDRLATRHQMCLNL